MVPLLTVTNAKSHYLDSVAEESSMARVDEKEIAADTHNPKIQNVTR